MKKTYLGLMGLFLLPQTALAVDAAAPASTSVSSPLAALWRVLLTPITVPHLPWQLPLLAPVALVLVLVLLIFCLLARRGGYRRGFREGERVVMRQMAREEQETAVPPMPHRPAPQQPAAPRERFGTKFTTAVNGFYKSLDDTFKNFTLTAENGLEQIRAQSIGGGAAKGE